MLQLMKLLGAGPQDLHGDAGSMYPHYEDGNRVCCGSSVLATVPDPVERLVILVLAFSVLNLRFPKRTASFMTYVQLYMMQIDEGGCVPQRTLKIRQQLP